SFRIAFVILLILQCRLVQGQASATQQPYNQNLYRKALMKIPIKYLVQTTTTTSATTTTNSSPQQHQRPPITSTSEIIINTVTPQQHQLHLKNTQR
ncbi:hypothetical protein OSTOST_18497, partial [Ostertagia ostertagi]